MIVKEYNLGEESGAFIMLTENGLYKLFHIPQYGGEPYEEGVHFSIEDCERIIRTWT